MNGHETILALRRRGMRPVAVWIKEAPGFIDDGLTVSLDGREAPERLDWRFLHGLTAIVEDDDSRRVERIARCVEPIARRVIANYVDATRPGGWKHELIRITDTEGVLTWQK